MSARKIQTQMVAKVWGCDPLPAPFRALPGERIGEIWFAPPPELPAAIDEEASHLQCLHQQVQTQLLCCKRSQSAR